MEVCVLFQKYSKYVQHIIILVYFTSLISCVSYHPLPLPTKPNFIDNPAQIIISNNQLHYPVLPAHHFAENHRLDMTDIAILAVINNPTLKLARDDSKIASVQAFAAGLLPNPSLGYSDDFAINPIPGTTNAFNLGISEDLGALLLRPSNRRSAQDTLQKTNLNLLWQEWQVIAQARILFIHIIEQQKILTVLEVQQRLLTAAYNKIKLAVARGDLTIDTAEIQLNALQDNIKQVIDIQQQMAKNYADLNGLLGLSPNSHLILNGNISIAEFNRQIILNELNQLPQRRPDLLALQYGYLNQEEKYRAAILSQFPDINVGVTRAEDNTGIISNGFAITMTLPIFNQNQGNIAIESTSRQKLYDEYQGRLNDSYSQVIQLLDNEQFLNKQYKNSVAHIHTLQQLVNSANIAYRQGNINLINYINFQANLVTAQITKITIEQNILEQRIGLQTLLGGELPID